MAAPTLDNSNSAEGDSTTLSATLSTTNTNDIIVACVLAQSAHPTGVASTHLGSFTKAAQAGGTHGYYLSIWYVYSSATLSSESITATWGSSNYNVMSVFGITGCYTASPLDPNFSLPATEDVSYAIPSVSGVYTTNPNDFILAVVGVNLSSQYTTTPSGFTQIRAPYSPPVSMNLSYQGVTSVQTNKTYTWGSTNEDDVSVIILAFTADTPPTPSTALPAPKKFNFFSRMRDRFRYEQIPVFRRKTQVGLAPPPIGSGNARVSQIVEEVISNSGANARVSQIVEEVIADATNVYSNARVSQIVEEVVSPLNTGNARVSQIVTEILVPVVPFNNPTAIFPVTPSGDYDYDTPQPGWSQHKQPTFATITQTAKSGREVRSAQQQFPVWEFTLTYEVLEDQTQNQIPYSGTAPYRQFQAISQLFLFCGGQMGSFYYDDPTDNSRTGQGIAVANGYSHIYTMVRTLGTGSTQFIEPVGGVNQIQNIYANDTLIDPSLYTFSGNQLVFTYVPAENLGITADFSYYYACQFAEDQHQYEEFYKNLWTFKTCKFFSILGVTGPVTLVQ